MQMSIYNTYIQFSLSSSSETQGQSVGTIQMFLVKVYCKVETSLWALTLTEPVPEAFELPASEKTFFWLISEEKQPGDSYVSLHDVVFLIDRHSCVALSTGKVSRGKFQNRMFNLTTRKNYKLYHGYKKQTLSDDFLGRIFRRYRKFL